MQSRLAVAAFFIGTSLVAWGQSALQPSKPEPALAEASVRRQKASAKLAQIEAKPGQLRLKWRNNGTIETAAGLRSRAYAGSRIEAARAFLREYSDLTGGAAVQALGERRLGRRTYVRMQQRLDGIPVRGAVVVVNVDDANVVHGINAHVEPSLTAGGEWRLNQQDAIERAKQAHGSTPSTEPTAERAWHPSGNTAIPVWAVVLQSANPAGDFEYLISAHDGQVIGRQDLRHGSSAPGYAYPRNPVRGDRERVTLDNLIGDGRLTSDQSKVFTYFPALRGQVAPGTVVQGASIRDGGFLYDADDARAAEVQLYWGMETARARFQALGFEGFAAPLQGVVFYQDWDADAQRFTGANNAFFRADAFGEGRGGVFFYLTSRQHDTSLDTDIIFHEYTHAVVNELVGRSQNPSFRALNEGTADYFSSSFLDDPVMAEYAAKIFGLRNSYVRRTDNEHAWPYSTVGEEHADGNIWSGALWDLRRVLGAAVADELALNTVAFLTPDSEFYDAAETAVLLADEFYGTRTAQAVAAVMERRGIFTAAAETASTAEWLQSGSSARTSVPAARPGYLLLGEQQYRITVPHRATKMLVRLRSSGDARFYLRYRVPVTIEDGKIRAEQMSDIGTSASGFLSLENTPELQAGIYYIGVVNASASRIDYTLDVEVENNDANARPALIGLEDGVAAHGSLPSGPFLGSRQFAIEVPEGTAALNLVLEGDEDVDLYVRHNRYVTVGGTGYPEADIISNSESSREQMRITSEGGAPLPAGVYVLGIYNYSQSTSRFRITARLER